MIKKRKGIIISEVAVCLRFRISIYHNIIWPTQVILCKRSWIISFGINAMVMNLTKPEQRSRANWNQQDYSVCWYYVSSFKKNKIRQIGCIFYLVSYAIYTVQLVWFSCGSNSTK